MEDDIAPRVVFYKAFTISLVMALQQTSARALYCGEPSVISDITTLLASAELGDRAAADALFTVLYDELHRMARRELSKRARA